MLYIILEKNGDCCGFNKFETKPLWQVHLEESDVTLLVIKLLTPQRREGSRGVDTGEK